MSNAPKRDAAFFILGMIAGCVVAAIIVQYEYARVAAHQDRAKFRSECIAKGGTLTTYYNGATDSNGAADRCEITTGR